MIATILQIQPLESAVTKISAADLGDLSLTGTKVPEARQRVLYPYRPSLKQNAGLTLIPILNKLL